jgi:hypothetical protein
MIRVVLQYPLDPDAATLAKVLKAAKALASGKQDEVIEQVGAAPADTFGVTVHVLADPEKPAESEE